jgi:hypothetical protein
MYFDCDNVIPFLMRKELSVAMNAFSIIAIPGQCFAANTPSLFVQGSDFGTIHGTVTDSSGALILNLSDQVQIANLGTLKGYSCRSDQSEN